MRPIYQDRFSYGNGNCFWACVASIMEIPLDNLRYGPPYDHEVAAWTKREQPYLTHHSVHLGRNYRLVDHPPSPGHPHPQRWVYDDAGDDWEPPTDDYWIGTIWSPGLKRPKDDPYLCRPLHAVVMLGRDVVHDPNPNYKEPRMTGLVGQTWWTEDW